METRAHHVLIGAFTVIVIAAALLFALWLVKSSADRQFEEYDIVFNEAVTGLSQGSAVQYNGIKVGSVTHLKLDPADPRRVLARIRLRGDTKELYFNAPDNVRVQLQDVRYRGGVGPLGDRDPRR